MKKLVFLTVLGLLATSSAFARNYGMAGCGLGSMIWGKQKGMIQILASTFNGIGGQTFAMSTGTSNCTDGSGKSATLFIEANKVALSNDIARGEGETIESLAALYGCQNSQNLGQALQQNYRAIFPSQSVGAERINAVITDIIKVQGTASCDELV